jgi:iron complex outermembrane receptor protein
LLAAWLAGVAPAALAGAAFAQAAPASVAQAGLIEEVVVTAQKREERLQDVPVAVSALTAQALVEKNVATLQDLSASVPGLVVASNTNFGSAPISIRGVGGANGGGNVFADEPVAVYVDGAVVGRLRMSTADLLDIGGVEVLRGPQGTLYGRNSTAGAVLLRSAEPTADPSGFARFTIAEHGTYKATGAVSGPLNASGSLTGRFAAGYSDSEGWAHDADGSTIGGSNSASVRGFLRWKPTDTLRLDLIAEHVDMKVRPALIAVSDVSNFRDAAANPTGSNVVLPYTPRPNLRRLLDDNQFALGKTFTKTRGDNITLKGDLELGSLTLSSISNFRSWAQRGAQDSDGTLVDPPTPLFVTGDVPSIGENDGHFVDSQWSQELRLASNGGGPLEWMVGAYVYDEKNKISPIRIRNYLAGPGTAPGFGSGTEVTFNAAQNTWAWALFANATYEVTDRLSATLGGRYSHEEKDFINRQIVKTINVFDPPGPTIFPAGTPLAALSADLSDSWSNFSPRVVVDYKFTPAIMGYASYSKGFKSGGFNAFNASPASTSFKPEQISAIELGLKSDLFDRRLRLNLAAFDYDYTNLQVRTPVPTGGVGIETADKAVSRGVELEANWAVSQAFRIDANVSWLDAKFKEGTVSAVQVSSFVFGANPAVVAENVAGNRLSRAPEWQGAINGRYTWETGLGAVTAQGSYRYQGGVFFLETQQNQPTFHEGPWSQVDARLALAASDGKWEVAAFGSNLLDDRHLSQITAFFALPNASVNEPRTFGLQLNLKY